MGSRGRWCGNVPALSPQNTRRRRRTCDAPRTCIRPVAPPCAGSPPPPPRAVVSCASASLFPRCILPIHNSSSLHSTLDLTSPKGASRARARTAGGRGQRARQRAPRCVGHVRIGPESARAGTTAPRAHSSPPRSAAAVAAVRSASGLARGRWRIGGLRAVIQLVLL